MVPGLDHGAGTIAVNMEQTGWSSVLLSHGMTWYCASIPIAISSSRNHDELQAHLDLVLSEKARD